MPRPVLKWIVRLRMWYADLRGHHGKNGTMNHQKIIWEEEIKNDLVNINDSRSIICDVCYW